jgi:hypothetical protein
MFLFDSPSVNGPETSSFFATGLGALQVRLGMPRLSGDDQWFHLWTLTVLSAKQLHELGINNYPEKILCIIQCLKCYWMYWSISSQSVYRGCLHCSKYGIGRNFLENRNVYVGKFYVSESHGPSRWDRGDLLLGRCLKTSVSSLVAPPRPRSLCSSTIVPGRYEQISCLFFSLAVKICWYHLGRLSYQDLWL